MLVLNDQKYIKNGDCSADINGDWIRMDVISNVIFDGSLALNPGGAVLLTIECSVHENKATPFAVFGPNPYTDANNGRLSFQTGTVALWMRLKTTATSGTGRLDMVALGRS